MFSYPGPRKDAGIPQAVKLAIDQLALHLR